MFFGTLSWRRIIFSGSSFGLNIKINHFWPIQWKLLTGSPRASCYRGHSIISIFRYASFLILGMQIRFLQKNTFKLDFWDKTQYSNMNFFLLLIGPDKLYTSCKKLSITCKQLSTTNIYKRSCRGKQSAKLPKIIQKENM